MEWLIAIAGVRFARDVSRGIEGLWQLIPGRARGWVRFGLFVLFCVMWFGFREHR